MSDLDLLVSEVLKEVTLSCSDLSNEVMQNVLQEYNSKEMAGAKCLRMIAWDRQ